MISSAIFLRYAKSLADVVFELKQEPSVSQDLATYREIFSAVPELLEVFDSPAVQKESKDNLLKELLARYPVQQLTANFLRLLVVHNRIRYFNEICDSYVKLVNEHKGIVSAQVTTAAPISEGDLTRLGQSLSEITGRTVTLDVHTDATLLGGVVVRIGSVIYDGSIKMQLAQMRQRLAEA
jgi:F-type H+-transporting ATPase subunit delta